MNAIHAPQNTINVTTVPHEVCANQKKYFRRMNDHVNKHHDDSATCTPYDSQDMDEGTSDQVEPTHTPYESDANNNTVLVNDGIETETDYLGCNDKSDEIIVDHLLNMAELESSVKPDNINEHIDPQQVTKHIELESFKPFSNEKFFWSCESYLANRVIEGSVPNSFIVSQTHHRNLPL